LKAEITILKNLDHPNIVKLKEVKKTKKHFYLVMEYCNGGELQSFLDKYQEKNKHAFTEEIVQYLMRQIMSAMYYLHSRNIMHRDIKLENILLKFDSLEDKEKLPPYLQESLPKYFYYNKNKEKEERRRKLIKYSDGSFNYIPVNCQKNCENNKNCIYAHNDNENEYHPLFYKTILSNNLGHGNDKRLVKGATNLFEDFRIIYN